MKKFFMIALAAMSLSMASCGSKDGGSSVESKVNELIEATKEKTPDHFVKVFNEIKGMSEEDRKKADELLDKACKEGKVEGCSSVEEMAQKCSMLGIE